MIFAQAFKPSIGIAAVLAAALSIHPAANRPAAAAAACPGGGVEKCTPHCSGPVLTPVCTYGPPCTCSLPKTPGKATISREKSPSKGGGGAGTKGTLDPRKTTTRENLGGNGTLDPRKTTTQENLKGNSGKNSGGNDASGNRSKR